MKSEYEPNADPTPEVALLAATTGFPGDLHCRAEGSDAGACVGVCVGFHYRDALLFGGPVKRGHVVPEIATISWLSFKLPNFCKRMVGDGCSFWRGL